MNQSKAGHDFSGFIIILNQYMSSIRDFIPLEKLGEGTFSTVYKVRRLSDQKVYALKKVRLNNLSQKEKENALNEIRILASINCQNIVGYKEAFFDDKVNVLCIVMEYADGGDLHNFISENKKFYRKTPQIIIWKVAADILIALDHLHNKGILHRDLKCANIFKHADSYKLGDLNVSKVNKGNLAYTQTGTPYYASPQVWRDQPYNHKSDIWSFGCILYQLASLKPPFQGRDMDELYKSIQRNSFTPIPNDYSYQLADLIEKCLQKNPKNRPQASQLLENSIIKKFRNRKNLPVDQNKQQKQLLSTIKLPNDLRILKKNLPGSKYDEEEKVQNVQSPKFLKQSENIKNFASDRGNYHYKQQYSSPKLEIGKNYSYVQSKVSNGKSINQSEVFLSPKNSKNMQGELKRQVDMDVKKHSQNNSQRKVMQRIGEFGQIKDLAEPISKNYSDRRSNSEKKMVISEKYDKFIQMQLQKRRMVMPRTQKRTISNKNKAQSYSLNALAYLSPTLLIHQRKDVQEWRKKLIKKSRVFSNNLLINRGPSHNSNQVK